MTLAEKPGASAARTLIRSFVLAGSRGGLLIWFRCFFLGGYWVCWGFCLCLFRLGGLSLRLAFVGFLLGLHLAYWWVSFDGDSDSDSDGG